MPEARRVSRQSTLHAAVALGHVLWHCLCNSRHRFSFSSTDTALFIFARVATCINAPLQSTELEAFSCDVF